MTNRLKTRRTPRLEALEDRNLMTASGGPNAQQVSMLELINQARTSPAAMATQVTSNLDANEQATVKYYNVNLQQVDSAISSTSAVAPLAWNQDLANAATGHSQDMANTGVQSHTGSDGSSPQQRMESAGYSSPTADGENAYAYATSVDQAMDAFLIDWGVPGNGHRNNLMDGSYDDVGIGIVQSGKSNVGPNVVTQDFGAQAGEQAQLLGAAFNDPSGDGTYSVGNGRNDVTVQVLNNATGQTQSVQTNQAGFYQVGLAPGSYTVTAVVGSSVVKSTQVNIGAQNVELNFDLSQPWQGGSDPSDSSQSQSQSQSNPQAQTVASSADLVGAALTDLQNHQNTTYNSPYVWNSWSAHKGN